ncbi:hypothetical protein [Streptomyces sp. A0592]|uniref:hypothetical protein n=1 Tax=Streptomyces sp. A0592 TaxID=2563099 RepID=UPI00109E6769|nr:hypothetical protein [Streptomyces sp. A0592]THA86350.1 hypothetical protein E6U81_05085 [Streptomyces sp. A0592]
MATRDPDPLAGVAAATAAGARLVFVPSRLRELGVALGSSVLVPLWIAAPLLLAFLFVVLLTDSAVAWALFWIVLGLTVLAVAGLMVGMMWVVPATMVRWIEFRPHEHATHLVIARFLRSSTVAAADLERIVVVERFRLGQRKSIKVVLQTGRGGETACEPAFRAPVSLARTEDLLAWLTGRLGSARAAVEYRKETDQNFSCPEEWWTPSALAALWQVPVSAVHGLADRHGIRTYRYTPRGTATDTVTAYHPGRAHEVAEQLHRERTLRPEAGGADAAPGA